MLDLDKQSCTPDMSDSNVIPFLEQARLKLLDLTFRNKLLNYPIQKKDKSIRFVDVVPDQLYRYLVDKAGELRFIALPEPNLDQLNELKRDGITKKKPDPVTWAESNNINTNYDFNDVKSGSAKNDLIQTLYYADHLDSMLNKFYKNAKLEMQETGAGISFLSLGFLEWYESDESEKPYYSPLLNIPIILRKDQTNPKSNIAPYSIKYTNEDVISNVTLHKKLKENFDIILPMFNEEMTPTTYLNEIKEVVKKKKRWNLNFIGALTLLNFRKMLMYLDLDPERWPQGKGNIKCHQIINRLFNAQNNSENILSNTEYLIDKDANVHHDYPLTFDADSSQHSAIIDVINGKNLVIEGPPGTGKSQTIANIISSAMVKGKKILFVAEKMAALEVVKNKLDKVGLGEYCLELHGYKSNKQTVLDSIKKRMDKKETSYNPTVLEREIKEYEKYKDEFNIFAEEINSNWKNTPFSINYILTTARRYKDELDIDLKLSSIRGMNGSSLDSLKYDLLTRKIDEFQHALTEILITLGPDSKISQHPWFGIKNSNITPTYCHEIIKNLQNWNKELLEFERYLQKYTITYPFIENHLNNVVQAETLNKSIIFLTESTVNINFRAAGYLDTNNLDIYVQKNLDIQEIMQSYTEIEHYLYETKFIDFKKNKHTPRFINMVEVFCIEANKSVNDIILFVDSLKKSEIFFASINTQIKSMLDVLPSKVLKLLEPTKTGLIEISNLISVAAELPEELIIYRDTRFDLQYIDRYIVECESRIQPLKELSNELCNIFILNSNYDTNWLDKIKSHMDKSNVFSWFNKDWREARKNLKKLAIDSSIPMRTLVSNISKLLQYNKQILSFEECNYSDHFGMLYNGIDTDCKKLKQIRTWYKKTRSMWGFGFGGNVPIAMMLQTVDAQIFLGIQHFSNINMDQQIKKHIDQIAIYEKFSNLLSNPKNRTLVGENNLFSTAVFQLTDALTEIRNWFNSEKYELSLINDKIALINLIFLKRQKLESDKSLNIFFTSQAVALFSNEKEDLAFVKTLTATLQYVKGLSEFVSEMKFENLNFNNKEEYLQFRQCIKKLTDLWIEQQAQKRIFVQETDLNIEEWFGDSQHLVTEIIKRNTLAINHGNWLLNYTNFLQLINECKNEGLEDLIKLLLENPTYLEKTQKALKAVIFNQLADEVASQKSYLFRKSFTSRNSDQKNFIDIDRKITTLQSERTISKIDSTPIPQGVSGGTVSNYTNLKLIEHELNKKVRHIPLRQLINRSSDALLALKPCFMMSPMSVAQYLEAGSITFDLVVMDEASQLKPQDALGVIARGKQVVIVGDPKQLPPSNFFNNMDMNDDDDDDAINSAISETESILDSVTPIFTKRSLRWHYRSRHESLIRYSNHKFYDNNLIVFPSPNTDNKDYGIFFHYIDDGIYFDRHNTPEAKKVAEAVIYHALNSPNESLGVVTMNVNQQEYVERAIEEKCKEKLEYKAAMDRIRSLKDSFFVKNLENVQGDERDVILISFTYGPHQKNGRIFQRFGPINNIGGWRRLNVLFTRARKRMLIFSSMKAEDILIDTRASEGVRALRGFLHYAEHGNIEGMVKRTSRRPDNDFEISVINRLQSHGYICEPQVGVAGYFIDIGIKDPKKSGRFIMGIECDGATYHSAKSARDRDRLRQEILENLGWRIRRIWSTDWFINPDEVIKPILAELSELSNSLTKNKNYGDKIESSTQISKN